MRSAMVVSAVLWATAAGAAEASTPEAPESAVQARRTFLGLSVLPLGAGGALGLEAERAVGERVSVRLGVRAGASLREQELLGRVSEFQDFQLAATPGVRFFLTGRAPEGLWVGPNLELSRSWSNSQWEGVSPDGITSTFQSDSKSWGVGAELLVGYSMVLRQGLTVQAGVGFGGGWSRSTPAGLLGVGGLVPSSGVRALQLQPLPEDTYVESWSFHERVSLAVGWAF